MHRCVCSISKRASGSIATCSGSLRPGGTTRGASYFKCWEERDHNSYIIREADSAGVDFIGFRVLDNETLDRLESDLRAYGLSTERMPKGDLLETGERVRFEIPSGHLIELYAEKTAVGNGLQVDNPAPWTTESEHGIAPIRLDHCLLYGPNVAKVQDIFCNVLGFYLVERVLDPEGKANAAIWLACSHKAHDIAFVEHPRTRQASPLFIPPGVVGEGAACRRHHVDEQGIGGYRSDPARHHARLHHLCVGPVGQPVRDLPGWLRALPGLCALPPGPSKGWG